MRLQLSWLAVGLVFGVLLTAGCVGLPERLPAQLAAVYLEVDPSRQLVFLEADLDNPACALLYPLQRSGPGWELAFGPIKANLGRNGIATEWEKREGDGRTPSGIYRLRRAFGYPASVDSKLAYHQSTQDDIWVDDLQSPDYNRLAKRGQSKAQSFEDMLLKDDLYKYGVVVEYNTDPVIKGLGSAIFLHVQRGEGLPTAGCVSVAEPDLTRLLAWLDPQQDPRIVIKAARGAGRMSASGKAYPPELPAQMRARLTTARRILGQKRPGDGFFAEATTVPPDVERQMLEKKSWHRGCPVPVSDLAYLVTAYRGFDGHTHYGELVVHVGLVGFYLDLLKRMYDVRFPIERMELIEVYDANDDKSMAANNTSAFNCRDVPGKPGVLSKHSYGAAIDINPLENPYLLVKGDALKLRGWDGIGEKIDFLKRLGFIGPAATTDFCRQHLADCQVRPPQSASYLDRGAKKNGMLRGGDPVVEVFKQKGFAWGGEWLNTVDYQHFEYDYGKLSR